MKPRPMIAALFAFLFTAAVLTPAAQAQDIRKSDVEIKTPDATVYVDGLACPFCAYGLEKKLNTLDALQAMEVQIEKGRVLLAFEKGQSLTKNQIQKAVKEAGFTARKIEFPGGTAAESPSPGA